MTTAVVSPPSLQPLSRFGWNSNPNGTSNAGVAGSGSGSGAVVNGGGGRTRSDSGDSGGSFSAEDLAQVSMPQRRSLQRSGSSSSVSSTSSTVTITAPNPPPPNPLSYVDTGSYGPTRRKPRGGFWSSRINHHGASLHRRPTLPISAPPGPNALAPLSSIHQTSPVMSASPQNGVRKGESGTKGRETPAVLALSPLNGTFERKQIIVPRHPAVLKVGRQTNAKTVPTRVNGFFDSKVLSRAHAEVWSDRTGRIWIRDVKSSNGTFINGQRLSPEARDSEPHQLREHDTLELGIDIISEDQKSIVHHKVSAKVDFAGIYGTSSNILDMTFADIDPSRGGGLLPSPLGAPHGGHYRSRSAGPNKRSPASSVSVESPLHAFGQQRNLHAWGTPSGVERLVKIVTDEMKTAKQQAHDLNQTEECLGALLSGHRSGSGKARPPKPRPRGLSKRVGAKPQLPKIDPISRFPHPPAPPPQRPLPEKPPHARISPIESAGGGSAGGISPLKRSDTAKPSSSGGGSLGASPTSAQSSQIVSLAEALSSAKREIESQGCRVKHLEDMLRQEKSARESAEERAKRLEKTAVFKPVSLGGVKGDDGSGGASEASGPEDVSGEPGREPGLLETASVEEALRARLERTMGSMRRIQQDVHDFRRRAEAAEADARTCRAGLVELMDRLRLENKDAAEAAERELLSRDLKSVDGQVAKLGRDARGTYPSSWSSSLSSSTLSAAQTASAATPPRSAPSFSSLLRPAPSLQQGDKAESRLPEHLERAMVALFRLNAPAAAMSDYGQGALQLQQQQQQHAHGGQLVLAHGAPLASIIGVVVLGVGMMAYLNGWQKVDK